MSDSLRPHESQHARPPCPSPTPGFHSDSCPSSQWCHLAISSSVVPFSSCPQSLPASESVHIDTSTQTLLSPSCWQDPLQDTLPKQEARQKTKEIISRQESHRHSRIHHLTQPCPSEGKKRRIKPYLLPLEYRNKSPLTRSQHKPLNQPFPPRAQIKKQEYNPKAWEEEISSGTNQKKWKDREI